MAVNKVYLRAGNPVRGSRGANRAFFPFPSPPYPVEIAPAILFAVY